MTTDAVSLPAKRQATLVDQFVCFCVGVLVSKCMFLYSSPNDTVPVFQDVKRDQHSIVIRCAVPAG